MHCTQYATEFPNTPARDMITDGGDEEGSTLGAILLEARFAEHALTKKRE